MSYNQKSFKLLPEEAPKIGKFIILALIFIAAQFAFAADKSLYVYEVESGGSSLYGYKNAEGKVILEAVYPMAFSDKMDKIAFVVKPDGKIAAIDRKGRTVLEPFIFDNGPDYIEEGLFRFVENGKIGFADKNGKKVIPAEYDFASPFSGGLAQYFLGGQRKYLGEHWTWAGWYETGYINKKREKFKEIGDLENGRRQAVTFDGKKVVLDANGEGRE